MKKITLLILILSLCLGLCACNRRKTEDPTTEGTTLLPTVLPTMDTNVPDPTVESNSTRPHDTTGSTDASDHTTDPAENSTGTTDETTVPSRRRHIRNSK